MTNANAESSKSLEIVCLNCNVNENEIKVINGGRKDFSIFEVEKEYGFICINKLLDHGKLWLCF